MAAADAGAVTMYGQSPPREETPELLEASFRDLLEEIGKLPEDDTACWRRASSARPDLTGESHRIMFLRCELFDAVAAARKICKYWTSRFELFGERLALLPLRLGGDGLLNPANSEGHADDAETVRLTLQCMGYCFMRVTGRKDSGGRAVVFADPSRLESYDKSAEQRAAMVRACWATFHLAIQDDEDVQRLGVVVVACPKNAKLKHADSKLMKRNGAMISGVLPVRLGAFHICHPPWFFGKVIYPLIKIIMPARLTKRINVETGKQEEVLAALDKFGLGKEVVPSALGGDLVLKEGIDYVDDLRAKGK